MKGRMSSGRLASRSSALPIAWLLTATNRIRGTRGSGPFCGNCNRDLSLPPQGHFNYPTTRGLRSCSVGESWGPGGNLSLNVENNPPENPHPGAEIRGALESRILDSVNGRVTRPGACESCETLTAKPSPSPLLLHR
ncbi:hypothetical protein SKAU_G00323550 [Synaphobranchus kaupii]|uniref:Uncharacterized protein n=1 Tax=Synaphobranchus kaupii TaxID=118154 RepID=A0A9Q1EPB6_SYNKA|nr:hypothetical protein SKAU_G00323550 [Synaphobranchus kaupii]